MGSFKSPIVSGERNPFHTRVPDRLKELTSAIGIVRPRMCVNIYLAIDSAVYF